MDNPKSMLIAMGRLSQAEDPKSPIGLALPAQRQDPTLSAISDIIKKYQDFPLRVSFGRGGGKISYKGTF